MNDDGLVAIVVAVLGLAGSGTIWGYRQFKKETPVRQMDASMAAADKSVQMAIAFASAADTRSKNVVEDFDRERSARQNLSERFEALERQFRAQSRTLQRFILAWEDLTENWDFYRRREHPPVQPRATPDEDAAT